MMHTSAIKLAQFKHYPTLFKKTYSFTAKLRLSPIVQAWLWSHPGFTPPRISLGYAFPPGSHVWPQSNACDCLKNTPSYSQRSDP